MYKNYKFLFLNYVDSKLMTAVTNFISYKYTNEMLTITF